MNARICLSLICVTAMMSSANAAIPYRVQQVVTPSAAPSGHDSESFARAHRFYIGGAYDYSMWSSYTDDNDVHVGGRHTSSYEGMAGIRIYDIFRIEANYIRTDAKYSGFSLTGNTAMVNAIFDARIDDLYRLFYRQHLVPYVGIGGGASWNSVHDARIDDKVTPVVSALAGIGIELGEHFTIDVGYRYMYMFSPQFDVISDLAPAANQFRAGVRINF